MSFLLPLAISDCLASRVTSNNAACDAALHLLGKGEAERCFTRDGRWYLCAKFMDLDLSDIGPGGLDGGIVRPEGLLHVVEKTDFSVLPLPLWSWNKLLIFMSITFLNFLICKTGIIYSTL